MHESGEMYLETILVLGKKKPTVRAVDVADDLGYSKPSVSRGLAKLKADGCIIVDADGRIALTEKGRQIAEKIYERHPVKGADGTRRGRGDGAIRRLQNGARPERPLV